MKVVRKIKTENRKLSPGFTLMELLVVIFIISILVALSLVSFGGSQRQARDTQRKSDLNQYRNALEAYAGANDGYYSSRTARQTASSYPCDVLDGVFMSDCLDDPGNNPGTSPDNNYRYRTNGTGGASATATQFVLWVYLETGGIWEVCSDGRQGKLDINPPNTPSDGSGNCEVIL